MNLNFEISLSHEKLRKISQRQVRSFLVLLFVKIQIEDQ